MPKEQDPALYAYTQDRELSWLRFNRRVLEEAGDSTTPLLERLKFISIFTSNLDEFFMVRVGSLFDLSQVSPEEIDNKTGLTPRERLDRIYAAVPALIELKDRLYGEVSALLRREGVCDLAADELTGEERKFLSAWYKANVLPVLSPQIVDSHHPFPHLASKALYVAALLRDRKGAASLGFIPVPAGLPPFVLLPRDPRRFVRMENLILHHAGNLFGGYRMESSCVLCVTRNADISADEEKFDDVGEDFRNRMSKLLKKRSHLSAVRLELSRKPGGELMRLLKSRVNVDSRQIYVDSAPLVMKYVYALSGSLPRETAAPMLYAPYRPRWPEDLDEKESMIDQIRRKDRLLFFPFDKVEPFLRLLSEAADRPDVAGIKITIYRLASSSKVAHILCRAAEHGKDVTVLMELRARFDEENNISWSRLLEDAGCTVSYGVEGFKCHSKLCLITLRAPGGGFRYITQVGTGNYNEQTNAMYTDLSLMTADDEIGQDGAAFFRDMLVGNLNGSYRHLLVAPAGIKSRLLELIDREIAKGGEGYICIKANSMTEREVMDRLSEASRAGVEVELILRGICCLRPGIPGFTENIRVTSIVGRFLEHARVYRFGRGEDAEIYVSSADLMTRNLNRRVEIACPVYDPGIRRQIVWILDTELRDNVKASALLSDGTYARKVNSLVSCASQEEFMHRSVHSAPAPAPEKERSASPLAALRRLFRRG